MFINSNDDSIPIEKRKKAYIEWAVKKGTAYTRAKRQAEKKFEDDCPVCGRKESDCDDERWFCNYCGEERCAGTVYLDRHMNDGRGNAIVFCEYCDSQIGWLYTG